MSQSTTENRRIVLNARPHGAPRPEDFRLETTDVPTPADGQLLLRTLYLSLESNNRIIRVFPKAIWWSATAVGKTTPSPTVPDW